MQLPAAVLAAIELAFNKVIGAQSAPVDTILQNRRVGIDFIGLDTEVFFWFKNDRVYVFNTSETIVDAKISGTPIALMAVSFSGQANTRDLQISGDLQVAQAFEKLFKSINVDWEEILSQYAGDAVAFKLGEVVRGLRQWTKNSASLFEEDVRDYLQIETRQLPIAEEVDSFNRQVDETRAAVERFEMRVQRLFNKITAAKAV